MELTVTVKANSVPTVVPSNWDVFEAARNARYEAAVEENSEGFQEFNEWTLERLAEMPARLASRK